MLAQYLDVAVEYNQQEGSCTLDVSNYDYCLVQPIGQGVSTFSTIDSGAVQGFTDGNALTATNFIPVSGTLIANGTNGGTSIIDGQIMRYDLVGRYIQLSGSFPIDKLLVMLAKIS
jgi:hypothetical protein